MSLRVVERAGAAATRRAASAGASRSPSTLRTDDIDGAQPQPRRHLTAWKRSDSASLCAVDGPRTLHRPHLRVPEDHRRDTPLVDAKARAPPQRWHRHTNPLQPQYTLPSAPTPAVQPAAAKPARPGSAPVACETAATRLPNGGATGVCAAATRRGQRAPGEFKRAPRIGELLAAADAPRGEPAPLQADATAGEVTQRATARHSELALLEHAVGSMHEVVRGEGQREARQWREISAAQRQRLLAELKQQHTAYHEQKRALRCSANAAPPSSSSSARIRPDYTLLTADITGTDTFEAAERRRGEGDGASGRHTNPLAPEYVPLEGREAGGGQLIGAFEQGVRSGMRRWVSRRSSSRNNATEDIDGAAPRIACPTSLESHAAAIARDAVAAAESAAHFSANNLVLLGETPPGTEGASLQSAPGGKRRVKGVAAASDHGSPIAHNVVLPSDEGDDRGDTAATARLPLWGFSARRGAPPPPPPPSVAERMAKLYTPYDAAAAACERVAATTCSEARERYRAPPPSSASHEGHADAVPGVEKIGCHPQLTFASAAKQRPRDTNPVLPEYRLGAYCSANAVAAAANGSVRQGGACSASAAAPLAFRRAPEKPLALSGKVRASIVSTRASRAAESLRNEVAAVRSLPHY